MTRGAAGVVAMLCVAAAACHRPAAHPNVVLIVLDTVRADHLSAYGYSHPTSPTLEAFARQAIRFTQAYSLSTWTLPAHASLFTGLYPSAHGATQQHLWLDDRFDTLAELLHGRGYTTAAFSGNPWVARATHMEQGFDVMQEMWGRPEANETGTFPHATNRLVFDWLARRSRDRPFFLFVNYIEPHFPYSAPATYEAPFVDPTSTADERRQAEVRWTDWYLHPPTWTPRLAALRAALYDAELSYVDAILGELLAELRRAGVYDDSIIVITSDHGENLGEHGHLDHVFSLYNTTLHVPLLLHLPQGAGAGTTRTDPVQLTDVFVTLAALTGADPHPAPGGRNLLDGTAPPDRALLAEYDFPAQALTAFSSAEQSSAALDGFRRELRSVQVGARKLIWASDGRHELYDLGSDPREERNLVAEAPQSAADLNRTLQTLTQRRPPASEPPSPALTPDAAARERLRQLGYLH